ncbi:MAG: hypothetical protein P1U37_09770 [Minwuia sp.]|nr:hypothetical protein [Minwuia sp.]
MVNVDVSCFASSDFAVKHPGISSMMVRIDHVPNRHTGKEMNQIGTHALSENRAYMYYAALRAIETKGFITHTGVDRKLLREVCSVLVTT